MTRYSQYGAVNIGQLSNDYSYLSNSIDFVSLTLSVSIW
jgi:hypothetical protein